MNVSTLATDQAGLEVSAEVDRGTLHLAVDLTVERGETLVLLGPNGAGKSTLLRCIAGLLPVDSGRITIGGVVVDGPDVFVSAAQRRVGMVFQDHLLFANLSVRENVAFGLRARGVRAAAARGVADEWIARMGLADRADVRPHELSGGQAQRIALARALATDPAVLLLDEPLSALDAGTRSAVRRDLRQHLAGFDGARVVVTHDPVDAFTLADRVAVMADGCVVQSGHIADVAAHPRSRYVADLVGVNLVRGTVRDGVLHHPSGHSFVVSDAADGESFAVIRPASIALQVGPLGETSVRNAWVTTVGDVDRLGDRVRLGLLGAVPLTAEITAAAATALDLRPGSEVTASVKATEIDVFPV